MDRRRRIRRGSGLGVIRRGLGIGRIILILRCLGFEGCGKEWVGGVRGVEIRGAHEVRRQGGRRFNIPIPSLACARARNLFWTVKKDGCFVG